MAEIEKKFVVNRNQIYLGKLYARCRNEKTEEITYLYCRHILLGINKVNLAQDLVYSTFQNYYAIDGVESPTVTVDKGLVFKETLSLNTILLILGYKEQLEQRDISSIFRILLEKKDSIRKLRSKFVGFIEGEILYNKLIEFLDNALYKPNPEYERFEGNKPKRKV